VAGLYLSSHTSTTPAMVEAALKNAAVSTGKTSNGGQAIKLVNARLF
jgi:hypothetical protein